MLCTIHISVTPVIVPAINAIIYPISLSAPFRVIWLWKRTPGDNIFIYNPRTMPPMSISIFVMPYIFNVSKFCRHLIFIKILQYRVYFFFRKPILHRDPAVIFFLFKKILQPCTHSVNCIAPCFVVLAVTVIISRNFVGMFRFYLFQNLI